MVSRRGVLGVIAAGALRGQERKPALFGDAEAYERFMGRWSRMLAPHFVEFSQLRDRSHVLDVGSGTGVLSFTIAKRMAGCRVVGIDPSGAFVEFAKRGNPWPDRVSFEAGDAQQMRFADASFDASVSLLVFNFIPDAAKALRELKRVTRPAGVISAAVWDYGEGMRMLRVFWDAAVATDAAAGKLEQREMPLSRGGELSALWAGCGLNNTTERALEITMRFKSFADCWDPFLRGQGPSGAYMRGLDSRQLQALRSELKRRLGLRSEDSSFRLTARAWAVRGTVPELK